MSMGADEIDAHEVELLHEEEFTTQYEQVRLFGRSVAKVCFNKLTLGVNSSFQQEKFTLFMRLPTRLIRTGKAKITPSIISQMQARETCRPLVLLRTLRSPRKSKLEGWYASPISIYQRKLLTDDSSLLV